MGYQWSILSSAKTVVAGLSGLSSAMVKSQKRPFFSVEHGHTLPFVSVCPAQERVIRLAQGNVLHVSYQVVVAMLQTRGATLENETELQWQMDRREEIMNALWKTSLSGTAVIDCSYDPAPTFDLGGLDKLFDVSVQLFDFTSNQPRSV